MTNDGEAEGAIKALNGAIVRAGTINVNEARPRLESSKGSLRLRAAPCQAAESALIVT